MRITTPSEVARQAGNKYLGVLVAAKFARYLNEFPKDQLAASGEKLTTQALQSLVDGELNYKLVRRPGDPLPHDRRRLGIPAGEPAHQLLGRRRQHEHMQRVRKAGADLPRALAAFRHTEIPGSTRVGGR